VDAGQPSTFLTPECGNPPSGGGPTTCYVSFQLSSDIVGRGWDGAIRGGAYSWCLHGSPYTGLQQVFRYEDYTNNSNCTFNCDQVSVSTQDLGGPNRLFAALLITVLLTGCGSGHRSNTRIEGVRAVDPSIAALSPDQKLDRSLSLAGMRGVLQGTIGKMLSVRTLTGGPVVTLDGFTVEKPFGFASNAAPSYTAGQHISLAVLGGHASSQSTTAEDAPAVQNGDHLLIFDQAGAGGQIFAQLGNAVIVLADRSAVARINPDGSVTWKGFTEPAASFTQHFTEHPAHG